MKRLPGARDRDRYLVYRFPVGMRGVSALGARARAPPNLKLSSRLAREHYFALTQQVQWCAVHDKESPTGTNIDSTVTHPRLTVSTPEPMLP